MMDINQHTSPAAPALSPLKADPIGLHMHAINSLSRCKAMLTAKEPMYFFAQELLAEAQQAIQALQAFELNPES